MTDISMFRVLLDARIHLTDPANWYQGSYRKDAGMRDVPASEGGCLCGLGAVNLAVARIRDYIYPSCGSPYEYAAEKLLGEQLPAGRIRRFYAAYNDDPTTTHADVLAVFDRAIAAQCVVEFLEFAKSKPADERYEYLSNGNCAFAQFLKSVGYERISVGGYNFAGIAPGFMADIPGVLTDGGDKSILCQSATWGGIVAAMQPAVPVGQPY